MRSEQFRALRVQGCHQDVCGQSAAPADAAAWTASPLPLLAIHEAVAARPERVTNDFKACASRAMNQAPLYAAKCKRWTGHGSMRRLVTQADVYARTR